MIHHLIIYGSSFRVCLKMILAYCKIRENWNWSENKINYHLMNLRKNSTCDFIGLNYWTSYISNNYTWSSLGQSTFIRCSCICTVWRSDDTWSSLSSAGRQPWAVDFHLMFLYLYCMTFRWHMVLIVVCWKYEKKITYCVTSDIMIVCKIDRAYCLV